MPEWRVVPSFPNYEISNEGQIRRCKQTRSGLASKPGYVMKQHEDSGYLATWLTHGGANKFVYVHRLVLEAFVGPCPKGLECNHKNLDRHDNTIENLEWISHSENVKHAYRHGCGGGHGGEVPQIRGEKHPKAKLTEAEVLKIRERSAEGESGYSIAKDYPIVSSGTVADIIAGRSWAWLKEN